MSKKFITANLFLFLVFHSLFANTTDYEKINKLLNTYPNHLLAYKDNHIIWKDGYKMPYDDNIKNKTHKELLNKPSLKDQLSMNYIKTSEKRFHIPSKNEDVGRVRYENFFKKMYGSTEGEIKKNLVQIKWMPRTSNKVLFVTKINDVHKKLEAISKELDELPEKLKLYVNNPAGTFKYRNIFKTNRLSMHSFGMAIDINVDKSHYWKWDKEKNNFSYKNLIPIKIVEIFEKHGFIWGGRWYHYDTMHFEYRPELLN